MSHSWKVRFISWRGEACFSFATREEAIKAARTFQSYPTLADDDVIIETPDRKFIPVDRLDLLDDSDRQINAFAPHPPDRTDKHF